MDQQTALITANDSPLMREIKIRQALLHAPDEIRESLQKQFNVQDSRFHLASLLAIMNQTQRQILANWLQNAFTVRLTFDADGNPSFAGNYAEVLDTGLRNDVGMGAAEIRVQTTSLHGRLVDWFGALFRFTAKIKLSLIAHNLTLNQIFRAFLNRHQYQRRVEEAV
jgi:hypothetical protein